MILPLIAVLGGLYFLIWSTDRFIDGAATTAKYYSMPSLLVGIVIIGFSASIWQVMPNLAFGHAYGSNIANICLIIGIVTLISPIARQNSLMRQEVPLPLFVTAIATWQRKDLFISQTESIGSNLFNTLIVVGIASTIKAMFILSAILECGLPIMACMTITLILYQHGVRINRYEAALLLFAFIAYNGYRIYTILPTQT